MAEVKVEIGAEIKELQSKLNTASKDLKNFEAKGAKSLNKFSKSTKQAGKSLGGLQKGAANGSSAMTAFSRTVQDAPFGIMGVSNNITNLTEQFGYLKNKTGSAGGALKAMLKDLSGFGGITLAISVATSLLLVFGDEIGDLIKGTSKLTKENQLLTDSIKGLIGSVEKEVTKLEILLGVARDETRSKQQRQKAVEKINKLYPKYLGNLKLEGVNSETTTSQVNMLTKALVQQATVKGLLNRISEVAAKKFDAEQKKANEYITTSNKIGSALSYLFSTEATYTTAFGKGSDTRQKAIATEEETIQGLKKTIEELIKGNDIDFDLLFGGKGGTVGGVGDELRNELTHLFERTYQEYNTGIDGFQDLILNKKVDFSQIFSGFKPQALKLTESLGELSLRVNDIVSGGLKNAFSGIGQAIGGAMSGANDLASGLGSVLLGALGGVLVQLGQMAITTGVALEAIKKALLNPLIGGIGAIGAGIALIAVGSAFSAGAKRLGSSGGNSGGSNASSGGGSSSFSGGSSSSFGSSGGNGGGTVVFEIAGTKLVGVLSNTLKRNRNLGGTISLN